MIELDARETMGIATTAGEARVLVIGVGNEFRGDDALGAYVARQLRSLHLEHVTVREMDGEGSSLIEAWQGHDRVVVIDAFCSGVTPGLLREFDVSIAEIPKHFCHSSSHSFGLAEAIGVARRLGMLPKRMFVFGLEGRQFGFGKRLSKVVRLHTPELLETITMRIRELQREHVSEGPGQEQPGLNWL
jgi:hydrogenase maturation protease